MPAKHIPIVRRLRTTAVIAVIIATAACAGLVIYLRSYRLPAPTGAYAVGTRIVDMTDPARLEPHRPGRREQRSVVVQLWYPTSATRGEIASYNRLRETTLATSYTPLLRTHSFLDAPVASSGNPFPLVLMDHRWNGSRTQNTVLAEEIASHGYVVASIDHPYNTPRILFADGHVVRGGEALEGPRGSLATAAEQIDFWNRNLDLWAADARFVLDELAAQSKSVGDAFYGRLDTEHVVAVGHSFGGAVSLKLLGLDPRIRAGVNLDGWVFGGLATRSAEQPILIFYEGRAGERRRELEATPPPGTTEDQLDTADFAAVDASTNRFGGYRLYVNGTQHLDFTDQPLMPPLRRTRYTGPIAPHEIDTVLRECLLSFLDESLHGRSSALLRAPQQRFAEITNENVPPQR